MVICNCPDTTEHRISCENHPRNMSEAKNLPAFHVLAKVTASSERCSQSPEQKHFFVKAPTAAKAIALVEDRLIHSPGPSGSTIEKQFTVNDAVNRGSTGMSDGEEIYSL